MTEEDRKALAKTLLDNPLLPIVLGELEHDAMNRGVHAEWTDNETRAAAMAEVRAIRAFRGNLEASLQDTPKRKGVPA